MKSKLRVYVENLFDGALKTEEVVELREEILQNVIDKYEDMVNEGKSENEAYSIAVSGIGDVNDLLRSMGGVPSSEAKDNSYTEHNASLIENNKKPKTYLLCIAVALYIMSIIPAIIGDEVLGGGAAEGIGASIMFAMIAIATVVLIAYFGSKPKTIENVDKGNEEPKNPALKSIDSAIWSVITVIYFILSFTTGAWHITWIVFVIGHAITEIVEAIFELIKND